MCHFYIIYSKNLDRYYIGHTCDGLEARINNHNWKHKGFTGKANDWELVHAEPYPTKEAAYSREREVKSWKSRKLIEDLIGR